MLTKRYVRLTIRYVRLPIQWHKEADDYAAANQMVNQTDRPTLMSFQGSATIMRRCDAISLDNGGDIRIKVKGWSNVACANAGAAHQVLLCVEYAPTPSCV
jgi:hypothetical protein